VSAGERRAARRPHCESHRALPVSARPRCRELITRAGVAINGEAVSTGNPRSRSRRYSIDGSPLAEPHRHDSALSQARRTGATHRDPEGRPTSLRTFASLAARGVGRPADFNSEGLLLLTNDGDLCAPPGDSLGWMVQALPGSPVWQNYTSPTSTPCSRCGDDGQKNTGHRSRSRALKASTPGLRFAQRRQNREVKRVMERWGLKVARLIRVQFGRFIWDIFVRCGRGDWCQNLAAAARHRTKQDKERGRRPLG